MPRAIVLLFVVLLITAGAITVRPGAAQEGAPPAGFEIAPGVMATDAVFAEGAADPTAYTLVFAPGTVYEIAPTPTLDLVYVDEGAATLTLDASVTIHRAGGSEEISAGTEFAAAAGDYFVMTPLTGGQVRNEEDAPVAFAIASIRMSEEASATPSA